jgi:hypothetical protein
MSAFRARPARIRSALTTLLVFVTAGCGSDLGGISIWWNFKNQTDEAITIVWHRENGEQIVLDQDLPAGLTGTVEVNAYGDPEAICGDGELVAVDPGGREVARSPMVCNAWVIESSEPSTGRRDLVA